MKRVYRFELTGDHKYLGFYMAEDDHVLNPGETFDPTDGLFEPITRDVVHKTWVSPSEAEFVANLKKQGKIKKPSQTPQDQMLTMLTRQVGTLSAKVAALEQSAKKGAEA